MICWYSYLLRYDGRQNLNTSRTDWNLSSAVTKPSFPNLSGTNIKHLPSKCGGEIWADQSVSVMCWRFRECNSRDQHPPPMPSITTSTAHSSCCSQADGKGGVDMFVWSDSRIALKTLIRKKKLRLILVGGRQRKIWEPQLLRRAITFWIKFMCFYTVLFHLVFFCQENIIEIIVVNFVIRLKMLVLEIQEISGEKLQEYVCLTGQNFWIVLHIYKCTYACIKQQ